MISIVTSLRVDCGLLYIFAMMGHWDLRWYCSLTILFASCYRQCARCNSGISGRQLTDVEHMCESGLEVPSRVNALMSSSQLCFVAIHFHRYLHSVSLISLIGVVSPNGPATLHHPRWGTNYNYSLVPMFTITHGASTGDLLFVSNTLVAVCSCTYTVLLPRCFMSPESHVMSGDQNVSIQCYRRWESNQCPQCSPTHLRGVDQETAASFQFFACFC